MTITVRDNAIMYFMSHQIFDLITYFTTFKSMYSTKALKNTNSFFQINRLSEQFTYISPLLCTSPYIDVNPHFHTAYVMNI